MPIRAHDFWDRRSQIRGSIRLSRMQKSQIRSKAGARRAGSFGEAGLRSSLPLLTKFHAIGWHTISNKLRYATKGESRMCMIREASLEGLDAMFWKRASKFWLSCRSRIISLWTWSGRRLRRLALMNKMAYGAQDPQGDEIMGVAGLRSYANIEEKRPNWWGAPTLHMVRRCPGSLWYHRAMNFAATSLAFINMRIWKFASLLTKKDGRAQIITEHKESCPYSKNCQVYFRQFRIGSIHIWGNDNSSLFRTPASLVPISLGCMPCGLIPEWEIFSNRTKQVTKLLAREEYSTLYLRILTDYAWSWKRQLSTWT